MRIRRYWSLLWTFGCFLLPLAASSWAQSQPAAAETPSLEKIVDGLQNGADSVQKKVKELLTAVDSEASAKRISPPAAQGLRWSLRNLTSPGNIDVRAQLAAANLPVDDEAIMKTAQALQDTATTVRADSVESMRQAEKAAEKRCSDLVGSATTAGEVDAFLAVLERLRVLASGQPGYNQTGKFEKCGSAMRYLRECFDLTPSSDPAAVSGILAGLAPMRNAGFDFGKDTDFAQRVAKVLAPFKKALDDAQKDLDSALAERKPAARIYAALAVFEDALGRFTGAASFREPMSRDSAAVLNAYRMLCGIAGAMELRHWRHAQGEIGGARQSISQLQALADRRHAFDALLEKWGSDISESEAADARQFREHLHAELGAVKQPSELGEIVRELARGQREPEEGNNPRVTPGLSMQLSALAAAWGNDDLRRLTVEGFGGGSPEDAATGEDLASLRERAERDILSRALKAPELVQAPFESQPLGKAIDGLLGKLTADGEWRRALPIIEAQSALEQTRGAVSQRMQAGLAVRSYLAGQNFELAELWTDAAVAYKAVLAAALDGTPVREAADRLKALAKEHPEEMKAARPSPGRESSQILQDRQ